MRGYLAGQQSFVRGQPEIPPSIDILKTSPNPALGDLSLPGQRRAQQVDEGGGAGGNEAAARSDTPDGYGG